jgi:hypothetical protein
VTNTRAEALTSKQDYEFFELFGKPGTQFEYDLAHIARDAMTKGAQLRMMDASFPQELRLQVMKASVRYHSSTFTIPSIARGNTNLLTDKATSLFDTQHTSGAVYETLRELAEQAFFETVIFKLQTSISFVRFGHGDMYGIAPLFHELAEHMQHVELTIRVLPEVGWEATLKNAVSLWKSLRLGCPKLQACVFTVEVRFIHEDVFTGYYSSNDHAPFLRNMLHEEGPPDGECLGKTLTKLFAKFADKGPGMLRFVRVQHLQCDPRKQSATPHYGPLVAVPSSKLEAGIPERPIAARMLTGAYQLARTGEEIEHTFRAE